MGEEGTLEFRNAERLKFFTDAVVAIALTLLVLPLLESVPEAARDHQTSAEWLGDHVGGIVGLAVSFAVVSTFWLQHHRIFEHVASYTPRLMTLSFAWMLAVVFLQVPSALVYALPADRPLVALYIGTMAFGSLMITLIAWTVHRDPSCQYPGNPMLRSQPLTAVAVTSLYVVALVIGVVFIEVNYFAMFVMTLIGPARRVVLRLAKEPR